VSDIGDATGFTLFGLENYAVGTDLDE